MAFWICDTHKTAGKLTKRDEWNAKKLFPNMKCNVRIVSNDNALALGWKGLD